MFIIGIAGPAQSGKDSIANYLTESYGLERKALADKVRECAYALNPVIAFSETGDPLFLQEVVDSLGWEEAKKIPQVRVTLQRLGTDMGRNVIDQRLWINLLNEQLDPKVKYVIPDIRFPNEGHFIRWLGYLIYVERFEGGLEGSLGDHESESNFVALKSMADVVIDNNGTFNQLFKQVEEAMLSWAKEDPIIGFAQNDAEPGEVVDVSLTSLNEEEAQTIAELDKEFREESP